MFTQVLALLTPEAQRAVLDELAKERSDVRRAAYGLCATVADEGGATAVAEVIRMYEKTET